jgi:hypothetical protein
MGCLHCNHVFNGEVHWNVPVDVCDINGYFITMTFSCDCSLCIARYMRACTYE